MKTNLKKVIVWLGLSVLMMIFWSIGLFIGNAIFPSSLMDLSSESNTSPFMFFLVCALNGGVILYFIYNSRSRGWRLVGILFLIIFGIQYFMSQIETLWFNDSLNLPINGVWAIVFGGAVMNLIIAIAATWFTGKFIPSADKPEITKSKVDLVPLLQRAILFSIVIWPLVYFMAGYFIAWQFADVREFYSGTKEMASFLSIMVENLKSGLYFFQIFRGLLWILIALLVFSETKGSWLHKGIILGLLFSILGSSGLLLSNPYMPDMVRMGHLIETASSNFLWGLILARGFAKFTQNDLVHAYSMQNTPSL
jgi:hypothetical protein